jgi:hypothetical protein
MGMHNSGASGYLVKASQLTSHLPKAARADYLKAIEDQDADAVAAILENNMPKNFPKFESAFTFADEWESDELEAGEVYVCFPDDELYVKIETDAFEAIKKAGVIPEFQRWVTWG